MKSFYQKVWPCLPLVCHLLMVGSLSLALSTRADIYSYKYVSFTNSISGPLFNTNAVVLTNGVTLVVNSDPIPLRAKNGLAILASFIGTNAVAANTNVVYTFDLGIGGPTQGTN